MGVTYNSKQIVTDGLILALDPANTTSYNFNENLLTYSEQFDGAAWTKQSSIIVSSNTTISPDGTLTADTVTSESGRAIYQNINVSIGTTYTNSIYIKAGTATAVMFRDDIGAGRHIVLTPSTGVITSTGGTLTSYGSQFVGNGWYRYWITYVTDNTIARGLIRPDSSGSDQTFIVWGAQIERGSTPTNYKRTTDTAIKSTFKDLKSSLFSTLTGDCGLNTTTYGVPVLELNNNATSSDGQVQVTTEDLNTLALTQNFSVMFAAKKNFYGISGNNNGTSQLFQGATNGYTTGWRIAETTQGTPGNAFTANHYFNLGYNDINTSLSVNDSGSVNRMCICAFTVSPTTIFGFVNGNTSSTSNPRTYASGTNSPIISFTGAGCGSWNGLVGFLLIYNRALSQTEIEQNYNALRGRYGI
jgi:hypothetical protein